MTGAVFPPHQAIDGEHGAAEIFNLRLFNRCFGLNSRSRQRQQLHSRVKLQPVMVFIPQTQDEPLACDECFLVRCGSD